MNLTYSYRHIISLAIAAIIVSCSSKSNETTTEITVIDEEIPAEVIEKPTDIRKMSMTADSMALWADDLNPKEALAVLTTFYRVHLDAKSKGNRSRDIQTMRKYLDVYDIVSGNYREELRHLLTKVSEADSTLDLIGAVDSFRTLLADYDSAHGQGSEYTEAKTDSVAEDTVRPLPSLDAIDAPTPGALSDDPLFRPAE